MLTLAEFNEKFVYRREKSDKWTVLPTADGSFEGDCEDYVLGVLNILAGGGRDNMIHMVSRGDATLYRTHTAPGSEHTHMMMWVRNKGWIDCNHKKWSPTPHYPKEERIGGIKFRFRLWWKG